MNKKIIKTTKSKQSYEVGHKKPPKHTQFKKGQIANPLGITISPEKRALRELTISSVAEAIKRTFTCTESEIISLLDDPLITVGYKIILRSALDASQTGDYERFDHIIERAIGKVPSKIDVAPKITPIAERLIDKEKLRAILQEIEDDC